MWGTIFDFIYNTLLNTQSNYYLNKYLGQLVYADVTMRHYLAILISLVVLIFIFVLCCLFIYRIIKLVGGLIR